MSKLDKSEKHSKQTDNKDTKHDESESNEFLFIFECNDKFYSNLENIKKSEGTKAIIHPVYYSGYDNTMTSEDITWVKDRWVSSSTEGSWLDTLKEFPDYIFEVDDTDEVVLYEDFYYHCDGCLLETLVGPLTKISIDK